MTREEKLGLWVMEKHDRQMVKKTRTPYFTHLVSVAEMAGSYTLLGYEVGLCHDLFEDTPVNAGELYEALISFNYNAAEAARTTACVTELTDVFTEAAYPHLSKKERKHKEANRLTGISSTAQTVKYADLIYNINWVMEFDLKHAKKYLTRKQDILMNMTKGSADLHHIAMDLVADSLYKLIPGNSSFKS